MLVDPIQHHITSYLQYMDDHMLKIRSILLTSEEADFMKFYDDVSPMKRAFSAGFKIYAGFK